MEVCKNCNSLVSGKFCANCGQAFSANNRIKSLELSKEIFHSTFHTGNGMFSTLRLLLIRPEVVLRGYITGERKRFFNPVKLFLLATVIYMSVNIFIDSKHESSFMPIKGGELLSRFKYFFVFGSILINATLNWIFFRKKRYNYAEHLVVAMYVYSVIYLSMSVMSIVIYWLHIDLLYYAMILVGCYYIYAMTNFYSLSGKAFLILKNLSIYLLTTVLFMAPMIYYVLQLLRKQ